VVEARADLSFGRRWIPKGTRLSRTDPAVVADAGGHHFQIPAVPLSEVLERGRRTMMPVKKGNYGSPQVSPATFKTWPNSVIKAPVKLPGQKGK
jgi:hypothetical protein